MASVRRRIVKASAVQDDDESGGAQQEPLADDMQVSDEQEIRAAEAPTTSAETGPTAAPARRYWIAGMFFTRNERLWNVVRISGRVLSSTLGLIIILALYTLVGALLFVAIEGPKETAVRSRIAEERRLMLEALWNGTTTNRSLDKTEFISLGEGLLKNYTREVVTASQAGISSEAESPKKWNFWGAVFYSLTVYTTIGYGHIAPSTDSGRIATMLYATIGIPLCLVVLVKVGKIFTRILKLAASLMRRTCRRIKVACRRKLKKDVSVETDPEVDEENGTTLQPDLSELVELYEQQDSSFDVPIVVALVLVIIYMLLGAVLYRAWETWDYTEAVYFIFISISTIGFGDVLPEHPKFFLLVSVYIFVGLSLVSMVVNVLMDCMAEKLDQAQEKIKELANKDDSKESTSNENKSEEQTKEVKSSPKKTQPETYERVDKIDLSCIAVCTKDE